MKPVPPEGARARNIVTGDTAKVLRVSNGRVTILNPDGNREVISLAEFSAVWRVNAHVHTAS